MSKASKETLAAVDNLIWQAQELERLQTINAKLLEALKALLADMDELFASPDHLKMALELAEIGDPLTFNKDGPKTVRDARAAIKAASA